MDRAVVNEDNECMRGCRLLEKACVRPIVRWGSEPHSGRIGRTARSRLCVPFLPPSRIDRGTPALGQPIGDGSGRLGELRQRIAVCGFCGLFGGARNSGTIGLQPRFASLCRSFSAPELLLASPQDLSARCPRGRPPVDFGATRRLRSFRHVFSVHRRHAGRLPQREAVAQRNAHPPTRRVLEPPRAQRT